MFTEYSPQLQVLFLDYLSENNLPTKVTYPSKNSLHTVTNQNEKFNDLWHQKV